MSQCPKCFEPIYACCCNVPEIDALETHKPPVHPRKMTDAERDAFEHEIERLRAEVKRLSGTLHGAHVLSMDAALKDNRRQAAEIERLRAALRDVSLIVDQLRAGTYKSKVTGVAAIGDTAREALERERKKLTMTYYGVEHPADEAAKEFRRLRARIAELESALLEISEHMSGDWTGDVMRKIAREALEGKDD